MARCRSPLREREAFEAVVWANARLIASPDKPQRDAGIGAVMAAYDEAVALREKRRRDAEAQAAYDRWEAEVAEMTADLAGWDTPELRQARVAELLAALDKTPDERTDVA